ncbi:MAG: DUF5996 family protein [Chloroflexota bacterium]
MPHVKFPPLPLAQWQPSRDTVHGYTRVLGAVRRQLTPPQKHWWHVSLRAAASGLTTTPVPADEFTFDMLLDLCTHELCIATSEGDWWDMSLRGQPPQRFLEEALGALQTLGVEAALHGVELDLAGEGAYDTTAVEDFWHALAQIDALLKQFKGQLREETSPVQFWPHHFDLSLVWFSGNLVPGQDPADPEYADEQMAFGFSTGDEGTPEPYFYVTAYPWRDELLQAPLPAGARWHTEGWKGALLPYEAIVGSDDAGDYLLSYWQAAQRAGAALMQEARGPATA